MGGDLEQEGYRFDGFHLLPKRRLLLRDGRKVAVSRRALSVLIVLVEHHGRIVGRSEILDQAFPGVFVEDQNITVHISALRSLLGPGAIATIPGRGYRFAVALEAAVAGVASPEPAPIEPTLSTPAALTNLQAGMPVIGRETELAELTELLASQKLVTVTGPGGIGKTSVAEALGRRLTERFADGVWLVDLAPLSDPALVATTSATVLGVTLRDDQNPIDAIATAIARKHLLLIVDNAEYLVAASAELAQALLARVSGLTVLATSQEVLAVPIETVYRLDPLPVPPAEAAGAETIVRFGAVELFAARARTADRRFRLDDATAAGVAEICRALGGIPLALEMAAARVSLLGIEGVRGRLDDRLKLLVGRERIGAARHRTLRTMLEWSHGLLDPAEQRVFRRLAVFRGGFSLEAVIAVAGDNAAESWEVIDVLGKLIDKSLVAAEGGDAPRYRLLETLRFFAAEKLFASGEVDVVAERHARHVVVTLDRAYLVWEAGNDLEWLATNRPEIDNVRAALAWLSARPFLKDVFIDLVGTSARLFAVVGLFTEARLHAAKAESLIDDSIPPLAVARLLRQSGDLWANADRMRALTFLQRAADKYRQLEDYGSLAFVMAKLSSIHIFLNENEIAEEILLKAKSIAEKSIKNRSYVVVVGHLGLLYSSRQDYQMARSFYKESYDIADRCGIFQDKIAILANIAEVSWQLGDFDLSISQITEAIKVIRPIGNDLLLGRLLGNLSSYLILRDRIDEARIIEREAFHCIRGCGGYTTRISLQRCAVLAAASGDFHVAASVMGFVDAGFIKSGDARLATERKIGVRLVDILRQGLTSAEIDRHKVYGETWTEAKVLSLAETLLRLG